jgi:RHS repeat-associated protein
VLSTSLLAAALVPGCRTQGDAEEDIADTEEAVAAGTNLALGKTATQSSIGWGGDPSRAVDGNTDGNFGDGSVTHTYLELSPWWRVDLGSIRGIGTIELYNRTDCCSDRLSNFQLLLSDDGNTWQAWNYPGTAGAKTAFDVNRSARYVKVQLNSTGLTRPLSLAEVKVYPAANASPATSLPSSTLLPTSPVGAVEGQFDVDAQGAATYSIPIQVPPGTNGVEPRLQLAYRSGGANGLTGTGWGLAGISMITRCPRTMAQDGVRGGVNGDSNDRFCLDGKRLIAVSGGDGGNGTQYRTEIESFSRVISSGTCGAGPCSFEVTDKSGTKAVFGDSADSKAMIGATVRAWGLRRLTSVHGNYLTVSYMGDGGQIYPQQILYTMNDAVPSLKTRRVAMSYEDRTDTEPRYVAGYKLTTGKRLTSIKTFVTGAQGEVAVRDYRLTYTTSPATKRSLLSSISECDAQGVCLPATQLDYFSAAGSSFTEVDPQGWIYQDSLRYNPGALLLPGDYNGDGKTDFLRQERGTWGLDAVNNLSLYTSNGDGTFNLAWATCPIYGVDYCQSGTAQNYHVLYPMDINGDGKMDVLNQPRTNNDTQTWSYLSSGNGAFQPTVWYATNHDNWELTTGDFNGDGRADYYAQPQRIDPIYSPGALFTSNGDGSFTKTYPTWVDGNGLDWFGTPMSRETGAFLFTGDWNGDGLTDLLRQEHGDWGKDTVNTIELYTSKGDGTFSVVQPHLYDANGEDMVQDHLRFDPGCYLIPGDFNGDGLTDIIRQEYGPTWGGDAYHTFRVYFSNGAGNFDVVEPSGSQYQADLGGDWTELIPLDYNGDHKTDFLRRSRQHYSGVRDLVVYVSRGDGTFDVVAPASPNPMGDVFQVLLSADNTNVLVGDYNGDGKSDFLRQEGGTLDADTSYSFQVFFADGDRAVDSLKKVTNGLGGTVDVQYAPLTDSTVYTKGSTASGARWDYEGPMYVVKSYTSTSSPGQAATYSYAYSGAVMDRDGRGFLGFATVSRTDASTQGVTVIEYDQSGFPLTGTVKSRTLQNAAASPTAKVRTSYTYATSNTYPGVSVVVPTREEVTVTEAGQSYKTVKEYEYDAWGNLTLLHDRGLDGDASDDVDTCTKYSGDDGVYVWRLNYPTYTRVAQSCTVANGTCQCSGILDWIDRYYDWTVMNLTAVYEVDDHYNRWLYAGFTYDALGNVITRSLPGKAAPIVEANTYDPDYRTFPVAQTKTGGLLSLTRTSTFDPRFGVQISLTDANGNTTTTALDGLGRTVGMSQTSPDGYVTPTGRVIYGSDASGAYRETRTRNQWQADDWRWQREYLDGNRRPLHVVAQSDGASPILVDRTFDAAGEVASETLPYYQGSAAVTQSFLRDFRGRLVQITDAAGTVTKLAYGVDTAACPLCAGKVVTTEAYGIAPKQRAWTRNDDVLANARRLVDPDGKVTTFGYDRLERRTSVSDAVGTTTTVYDSLNRVTSVTSPDRGTFTNEYGAGDWLSSTTDANGVVTTYTYDDLGRVTQKAVTGGETTTFAYDNQAYANGLGRLTSVKVVQPGQATPSSSNDFSYTPDGSIATNVVTIDGHAYALSSTYDPEGRLRTLTYPDGSTLTRSYNAQGQLSQLAIGGAVYAQYSSFNASGQPGALAYANGTATTYSYDALRHLTATATTGPNSTSLLNYQYTWDPLHQITQIADLRDASRTQTFAYSAGGQLTQATGVYGTSYYSYDAVGNLTGKDWLGYNYTGHRVTSGTIGAGYDAAGNRTGQLGGGNSFDYQYGAENRLKQVTKNGAVVEQYGYDFTGERVKKVDADGTTTYYVTPAFEVTFLPDGRRLETKYVNGAAGRVAAITTQFAAGAASTLDYRGLDSASRLFDRGSVAGLAGYLAHRLRALRTHPHAPIAGGVALAFALAAAGIALARRRAPGKLAATLRALRAVVLPEKTAFVRRHPVFAAALPIVTAAFLSACTQVPGGERYQSAEQALDPGANGAGYPVAGTYFFHQNHVGSSSVITDSSGVEVARAEYRPYGEIDQAHSPGLDIFRSKFTGKEWDKDAGLYYFNARYYDPATGRFMSADARVQGGAERSPTSLNPYAYANNSPIVYTDPSGRFFWLIIVVAVIAGAYLGGSNANGGAWNPASWNWSSWSTYVGMGVGGLVGGLSAGVGVGVGGVAGAFASALLNALALDGLKFLSPGYSWQEFGKDVAIDVAIGTAIGGGMAGPRDEFGKAFAERIKGKMAQQATSWLVAKALARPVLKIGKRVAMGEMRDNNVNVPLDPRQGRDDTSSRSRPLPPPETIDSGAVSVFVSAMADAVLGAAGGDDVPGRASKDLTSSRRRNTFAPSFAMGW